MSDYTPVSMLRARVGAPVDHARELARHMRGISRPVVMVSYTERFVPQAER